MSSISETIYPVKKTTKNLINYRKNLIDYIKIGALEAKPYYIFFVIYVLLTFLYLAFMDQLSTITFRYYRTLLVETAVILPTLFLIGGVMGALRRGKHRRIYALKTLFNPRSVSNFLLGIAILTIFVTFLSMFTAVKSTFGPIFGFTHDVWQADLDQFLFFGHDPWQILFLPIHSMGLQKVIEINYNILWHVHLFTILAFVAYSDFSSKKRVRYLLCTLLVWSIVGTLFAGMFLSAGPAFYALVTGDELRFGEQMALLKEFPESSAIIYQAYLWNTYIANTPGFGTGIAAFPSLHVSFVVLNMLFAFEINKKLGFIALFYALFVWFSSVYLAWHYAIDGLVGGILVAMIYYVTRRFMSKDQTMATAN